MTLVQSQDQSRLLAETKACSRRVSIVERCQNSLQELHAQTCGKAWIMLDETAERFSHCSTWIAPDVCTLQGLRHI